MQFKEAFNKAWEKTPAQARPKGDKNIPKILAFLWTMIVEAEGNLDDSVYIYNDRDIISIPSNKKETKKQKSGDSDAKQTTLKNKKETKSASKKIKNDGADTAKINDGANRPDTTA
jgi:hypothetical protein